MRAVTLPLRPADTYVVWVIPTDSNSVARERLALAAVLLVALALRVWGIGFGLPHLEARPDELEIVQRAIRLLSGDLNPHFFTYPSLYFYVLGAVYATWAAAATLMGGSWEEFLRAAAVDPGAFILVGRWVSAVAGVATVYVVFRLGKRLHSARAGILAAGCLAVAHLHVRDSHFATTDVTLALFLAAAVLHLIDVTEQGTLRSYLWAGIFTGLAVSTKYVGLIMPGVLLFAHALRHGGASDRAWIERARIGALDPLLWAYFGAGLAAFVATSPYAVLDWGLFTTHFRFQMSHLAGGHGLDLGIGGLYHLRHTLPKGLGWPLFTAALVGGGWAGVKHPRRAAVLFLFPALFYLSTATGRTVFLRYMLPLIPFFCVAAGWWLAEQLGRLSGRRAWLATGVVCLVLLTGPLRDAVQTNRNFLQADTRNQATAWLLQEVEFSEVSIYQTGAQWGRLQLPLTSDSLAVLRDVAQRASPVQGLERLRAYTLMQAEARLAASRQRPGGFRVASFSPDSGFGGDGPPDWVAVMRSPLHQYSPVSSALESVLDTDYERVREFRATGPDGVGWYDQHDAFYLPFKRIGAVARPGPDVALYRRIQAPDSVGITPGEVR